jgi:7-cyano-7-deazaguanine synthase
MLLKDFHQVKLPLVVSLSGGMDSSVLTAKCVDLFGKDDVSAVSFDYGQRHDRELTSAMAIASFLRIRHKVIDIRSFRSVALHSSQTDRTIPVPHGHYEDASMKTTVVPNRNSIFLNYCAAWAISIDAKTVAYAAHAGDHAIYPDCRPEFAIQLAHLFETIHYDPIDLFIPYVYKTKRELAQDLNDVANGGHLLRMTYSCYEGREKHCGKCGTCVERKEALEGFDPTEYEA